MKKIFVRFGLPIVLTCVAAIMFIVFFVRGGVYADSLSEMRGRLAEQEQSVSEVRVGSESLKTKAVYKASGLDRVRVRRDDQMVDAFFHKIFTWRGDDQYREARQYIIDTIGEEKASQILNSFFLELPELTDEDGNIVVEFGDHANMAYDSMDSYVLGVHDGVYDYVTVAYVTSVTNTNLLGRGECVFFYSVDDDENFVSIKGYVTFDL